MERLGSLASGWKGRLHLYAMRGQVFMVDPQPQSQAAAPAVFAVAAETEAQGVVKPSKAPETSLLPRREKALSCN